MLGTRYRLSTMPYKIIKNDSVCTTFKYITQILIIVSQRLKFKRQFIIVLFLLLSMKQNAFDCRIFPCLRLSRNVFCQLNTRTKWVYEFRTIFKLKTFQDKPNDFTQTFQSSQRHKPLYMNSQAILEISQLDISCDSQ